MAQLSIWWTICLKDFRVLHSIEVVDVIDKAGWKHQKTGLNQKWWKKKRVDPIPLTLKCPAFKLFEGQVTQVLTKSMLLQKYFIAAKISKKTEILKPMNT